MRTRKIYKYLIIFVWIAPLILAVITIAIARDYYVKQSRQCWLNTEEGLIWAFLVPIILVLVLNTIILIVCSIASLKSEENKDKLDSFKCTFIIVLVLTPVLGLPWIVLLLNLFIIDTLPVEWAFNLLLCPVGVVFLLVVTISNKEVKNVFRSEQNTTRNVDTESATSPKNSDKNFAPEISKSKLPIESSQNVSAKEVYENPYAHENKELTAPKDELQLQVIPPTTTSISNPLFETSIEQTSMDIIQKYDTTIPQKNNEIPKADVRNDAIDEDFKETKQVKNE